MRLRVPDWMPPAQVTLWVDDTRREASWDGSYVVLDTLPAGSAVSLRCPLATREEAFAVNDQTTLAYWHGSTVVDVLPVEGPAAIYRHRDDALRRAPGDAAEPISPAGQPTT